MTSKIIPWFFLQTNEKKLGSSTQSRDGMLVGMDPDFQPDAT